MTTKSVLVIVLVLLVIATFIASILYFSARQTRFVQNVKPGLEESPTTNDQIKVPNPNETVSDPKIAIPLTSQPSYRDSPYNIRSFNLNFENGAFSHTKIIVHENDIVHINLTSSQHPADLTFPFFNIRKEIKPGETQVLEFQATARGSYEFYCQICGEKNEKTSGTLVVVPK